MTEITYMCRNWVKKVYISLVKDVPSGNDGPVCVVSNAAGSEAT